jgi:hypothetical protein
MKKLALVLVLLLPMGLMSCQTVKDAIATGWEISSSVNTGGAIGLIPPPPSVMASPFADTRDGWLTWGAVSAQVNMLPAETIAKIYAEYPPPVDGSKEDWLNWQTALIGAGLLGAGGGTGGVIVRRKMKKNGSGGAVS